MHEASRVAEQRKAVGLKRYTKNIQSKYFVYDTVDYDCAS